MVSGAALRDAMSSGRVVGTFVKLPALASIDLAAEHFDFVVVDREHSTLCEADALRLLQHAAAIDLPALLRVPELSAAEVNRALEAGATGIQLSQVRSADEVRALRAACEYAPSGRRSISLAHPVARYGAVGLREHVERSSGEPVLVAQLEAVRSPEDYAATLASRPDVAFVGVTDLTVDAGFHTEVIEAAIADVADAAAAAAVTLGAVGRPDDPRVRYLMLSSDVAMLRDGMEAVGTSVARHAQHPTGEGAAR